MLLVLSTAMPATSWAQDNAGADRDAASDADIVVTAQRYEQRLQDVPLSIGVVGSKELAARAVTDLKDLQYSVPGLSTFDFSVARSFVQLRGISNTIGSSTVGVYLDETPLAGSTNGEDINVRLIDLERVEVLRGPQATLYGQSSMGGTIRYIPAAPRLDRVGGSAEAEYSSTRYGDSSYKAVAVINMPLSTDKVGLRVVGGYERIGGYIDNVVTGERNVNAADVYTFRGTLLARPSDQLSLSLMGVHQKSGQDSANFGVDYKTTGRVPTAMRDRYTLIQAKGSYDLDFAEFSVSGSYIDRSNLYTLDLSDLYGPYLPLFGIPAGFIDRIPYPINTDYNIYSSEVRLASLGEGPLSWQIGATYRDLKTHTTSSTPTSPGTLPFDLLAQDGTERSRSFAVYGEATYAFTPQLKAIAGVRYFRDRKRIIGSSTNFGATVLDDQAGTFDTVNPRVNISYAFTPDSMIFVNIAKGFRSGGFNLASIGPGIPLTYQPDQIWTYEVGTKHQLLDNRLILDASVYRSEWSKVQSYSFLPGSALTIVTNSGEVSGWGVDLAVTARPTRALTLSGSYGWNNLEYDKGTGDKLPGDPVDGAVRESYSASLDFRPALSGSVTGIFRLDYQHAGKSQITLRNFGGQIIQRPSRDLVNARIGVGLGPVEVSLFANNLFDENAPIIIGPFGAIGENTEQRPRVIGVSANAKF
jgi:outer membrane receptor protein involved in Fe transport